MTDCGCVILSLLNHLSEIGGSAIIISIHLYSSSICYVQSHYYKFLEDKFEEHYIRYDNGVEGIRVEGDSWCPAGIRRVPHRYQTYPQNKMVSGTITPLKHFQSPIWMLNPEKLMTSAHEHSSTNLSKAAVVQLIKEGGRGHQAWILGGSSPPPSIPC